MRTREVATMRKQVEEVLEKIRPAIQADGGDVQLVDVDEESGNVRLQLLGACQGCPMSMLTLKAGIERTLARLVPGVKNVETV